MPQKDSIANFVSFSHLSPTYSAFAFSVSTLCVPTYRDALLTHGSKSVMDEAMVSLHSNLIST